MTSQSYCLARVWSYYNLSVARSSAEPVWTVNEHDGEKR
jgi:hypothetical protein